MQVVIAGGSGFLGTALARRLAARGDAVVILTRRQAASRTSGPIREVAWRADGSADASLAAEIDGAGAVVNLAGAGIADRRWSESRKKLLRDSRIQSTRSLVRAVQSAARPPSVFIQGSGIGYYGSTLDDRTFDESHPAGDDFLGRLCVDWEQASKPVEAAGCRLVLLRTGLVLERQGGVLGPMKLPFLLFAGGPVASGRQYFSWIHMDDWLAMTQWAIDTPGLSGPINATAPHPVTNAEFSKALGRALRRPSWIPVPAFAVRIAVGEFATVGLIRGQRVAPKRALELGFRFEHTDVGEALERVFTR
jgi:uncharacterized protein (TIGR01777 family)